MSPRTWSRPVRPVLLALAVAAVVTAGLLGAVRPAAASGTTAATGSTVARSAAAQRLPLSYATGGATQVVTVVGHPGSSRAVLQRWSKSGSGWVKQGLEVPAWVGANGITSNAREGYAGTPAGSFTLTRAFGRLNNPHTRLGYTKTDSFDWWSGDSSSPTYNTHQRCAASQCRFDTGESENLYQIGAVYDWAVVIDYNVRPVVPHKGSAFFWHVTNGQPTGGCVAIARDKLYGMMQWLQPSMRPRIVIGNVPA